MKVSCCEISRAVFRCLGLRNGGVSAADDCSDVRGAPMKLKQFSFHWSFPAWGVLISSLRFDVLVFQINNSRPLGEKGTACFTDLYDRCLLPTQHPQEPVEDSSEPEGVSKEELTPSWKNSMRALVLTNGELRVISINNRRNVIYWPISTITRYSFWVLVMMSEMYYRIEILIINYCGRFQSGHNYSSGQFIIITYMSYECVITFLLIQ